MHTLANVASSNKMNDSSKTLTISSSRVAMRITYFYLSITLMCDPVNAKFLCSALELITRSLANNELNFKAVMARSFIYLFKFLANYVLL